MKHQVIRLIGLLGVLVLVVLATAGTWSAHKFFCQPVLGARGANKKQDFDTGLDRVDAHLGKYKTIGDPKYTTLSEALSTIGNSPVTLIVPAIAIPITNNTTIPPNVNLRVLKGAVFQVPDGVNLTLNSSFEAGRYQVFSLTGTGKVVFGAGAVKEAYPEWWGAAGDGTTDDFAALQACLSAAPAGCTIQFQAASYYNTATANGLVMPQVNGITLQGRGMGVTKLIFNRTGIEPAGLYCDYQTAGKIYGLNIRDMTLQGRDDGINYPYALIYFPQTSPYTTYDFLLERVELTRATAFGVRGRGSWTGHRTMMRDCVVHAIGLSLPFGTYGCAYLIQKGDNIIFQNNLYFDLYQAALASSRCNWFCLSFGTNNYVTIDGNKFIGDNARVGLGGGSSCNVKHFRFTNNFNYQVYHHEFKRMASFVIQGNTFYQGIWTLVGCHATDNPPGAVGGVISGNVWYGSYLGAGSPAYMLQILSQSEDITISNNRFNGMSGSNERVIIGDSGGGTPSKITFQGNYLQGESKVLELYNGVNIKVMYNTMISTTTYPLRIHSTVGIGFELNSNIISGAGASINSSLTTNPISVRYNVLSNTPSGLVNFPLCNSSTLSFGCVNITFAVGLPNNNYTVTVTGGANETFYVTNKTTTGFKIKSSNCASTASVDYVVSMN